MITRGDRRLRLWRLDSAVPQSRFGLLLFQVWSLPDLRSSVYPCDGSAGVVEGLVVECVVVVLAE